MDSFLERLNHPLFFLLFIILAVTAGQALFGLGFKKIGWDGPAALFAR